MPPLDGVRDFEMEENLEGGRIFMGLGKEREPMSYICNVTLTSQEKRLKDVRNTALTSQEKWLKDVHNAALMSQEKWLKDLCNAALTSHKVTRTSTVK
jgi:hypothetical protein